MTPKEKAEELIKEFKQFSYIESHDLTTRVRREESNRYSAIECALICVDEIIDTFITIPEMRRYSIDFWNNVKYELEKL